MHRNEALQSERISRPSSECYTGFSVNQSREPYDEFSYFPPTRPCSVGFTWLMGPAPDKTGRDIFVFFSLGR